MNAVLKLITIAGAFAFASLLASAAEKASFYSVTIISDRKEKVVIRTSTPLSLTQALQQATGDAALVGLKNVVLYRTGQGWGVLINNPAAARGTTRDFLLKPGDVIKAPGIRFLTL